MLTVSETIIITTFIVLFTSAVGCIFLYIDKLASMRDTLFGIYMMDQIEQASVLDTLPDPVIIVDQDKISYMNSEAWSLLNCVGCLADVENFNLVSCIDKISGKV